MPSLFVLPARRPGEQDTKDARSDVRRASKDETDRVAVPERASDGGEERVEAACAQVQELQQREHPEFRVARGLLETPDGAAGLFAADRVFLHARVGEFTFVLGEPSGRERVVGEDEKGDNGDANGYRAEDDEQPSLIVSYCRCSDGRTHPAGDTVATTKSGERGGRNKTRYSGGNDIGTFPSVPLYER